MSNYYLAMNEHESNIRSWEALGTDEGLKKLAVQEALKRDKDNVSNCNFINDARESAKSRDTTKKVSYDKLVEADNISRGRNVPTHKRKVIAEQKEPIDKTRDNRAVGM